MITCGGLDLDSYQCERITFFHHIALKERFKYHLTKSLRKLASNDNLTLTKSIKNEWKTKHNIDSFYKLTQKLYEMKWYVWIGELFSNATTVIQYIGRYAKRPCISEASIRKYDGKTITFIYKCKIEKIKKTETVTIEEFIRRMIRHIPNKQYRTIRYYGLFANRTRGANFQRILKVKAILINQFIHQYSHLPKTWRERIFSLTKVDPLTCPVCKSEMILTTITYKLRDRTFNSIIF